MLTTKTRGRLVSGGALLLGAAFAWRFLESPFAAWAAGHASAHWNVAALALVFAAVPTVLQIVALSLATAALPRVPLRALPYVPFLWPALHLLLGWLGRPELKSWAATHLSLPLWRLWTGLAAGQVSVLSHGFGARQVVAALLGAAIASACLRPLWRAHRAVRVTGVTVLCLNRPPSTRHAAADPVGASPSEEESWYPQESSLRS